MRIFVQNIGKYENSIDRLRAVGAGVPVVSGSTGWLDAMPDIKALCDEGKATFFWTSNFSLGVNLFFAVNRYLASLMEGFPQYHPAMKGIHRGNLAIQPEAKSREGFALGAVVAAEWTAGKKGFLTMDEMMHSMIERPQLLDIIK